MSAKADQTFFDLKQRSKPGIGKKIPDISYIIFVPKNNHDKKQQLTPLIYNLLIKS